MGWASYREKSRLRVRRCPWHRWSMVRRGFLVIAALVSPADAQPHPAMPELVGATEVVKFTGATGFIDDAIAFDDQRLAYVVTDGSTKAELHLVTLATEQDTVLDISAITLHPIALRLFGARAFVVGEA